MSRPGALITKAYRYLRVFGLRATLARTATKIGEMGGWREPVQAEPSVSAADLLVALSRNPHGSPKDHPAVDIIIPIFNGLALLRKCMDSVLGNSSNCRLILIDDASTDALVSPYLAGICGIPERGIVVEHVTNEVNLGFVATVNRGLRMTTHDVVILNTDTVVPPRWLERIMAPIVADPDHVASVTPMSNSATICSFPEPLKDNELLLGLEPEIIDGYFEKWGRSDPEVIPTGVGYCMAMNHKALSSVGELDEVTFGRGYGEENDWCMRAWRAGFRHVAACNLFIYHHHGGSFSSVEKESLTADHQAIVEARYPEMVRQLLQFEREDPLRADRAALVWLITLHERKHARNHAIVDIENRDVVGGSIEYRRWLVRNLVSRGDHVIQVLGAMGSHAIRLLIETPHGSAELHLDESSEPEVGALIGAAGASDIFINGLIAFSHPDSIAGQLALRPETKVFAVHDYASCCPSYTLLNSDGRYCYGETDTSVCDKCLHRLVKKSALLIPATAKVDISEWRAAMKQLLESCASVVCFSSDSREQLRHVYPGISQVRVVEHALREPASFTRRQVDKTDRELVVAAIGGMSKAKGQDILSRAVSLAWASHLPIRFYCIGQWAGYAGPLEARNGHLQVTGAYRREDLPTLLRESGASLVVVPSVWAETFSYTTSEAMLLGYPVVCFDLGAPAERVREFDCGMVVKDVSAEGMLGALTHILEHPDLIQYWSANTAKYVPPTEEEHIGSILACLEDGAHQSPASPRRVKEGTP